jgi:hypothetical protein
METWAIVILVVGTNLGTALLALLGNKKQLEHSDKRLERQIKAQREEGQSERRWKVRSEPLLKLRAEIARMAERLEYSVDLAAQVIEGVSPKQDKIVKNINKVVKEWNDYLNSGELYKTLHMQYQHELKVEGHKILQDYQSAYASVIAFWSGGRADAEIRKANEILKRNSARVSAYQSKINDMLEEL